jgi:hypothetical protein
MLDLMFALHIQQAILSSLSRSNISSKMPSYSDDHINYHGDDYSQYGDAPHNADPNHHNYDNTGRPRGCKR